MEKLINTSLVKPTSFHDYRRTHTHKKNRRIRVGIATRELEPEREIRRSLIQQDLMKSSNTSQLPVEVETLHTTVPTRSLASLFMASTIGFTLLACDLLYWHNFKTIDEFIHNFVITHVSSSYVRQTIGGIMLSNLPIAVAWTGWIASIVALAFNPTPRTTRHLGIASFVFAVGGGNIRYGDPMFVDFLKHLFHRERPSPVHSSFAFPSGHSTAAFFAVGCLLFVLLPAVMEDLSRKYGETSPVLCHLKGSFLKSRAFLWVLVASITPLGRLLADAHWLSDVSAGALVGSSLVYFTMMLCYMSDFILSRNEEKEKLQ